MMLRIGGLMITFTAQVRAEDIAELVRPSPANGLSHVAPAYMVELRPVWSDGRAVGPYGFVNMADLARMLFPEAA